MDISVEDLNSVDKELTISATREDLEPKFKEAFKKYRSQINMPGFRPGKVPMSIIRKRFGDEIEYEEINKYIQEIFEEKVVPEYEPVGEPEMIDLTWEDDQLEAKFKIGSKPDFELTDFSEIEVDKMVHDVTDEEVEQEIERLLEEQGEWKDVDEKVTEKSKVVVDVIALDQDGEPVEAEKDEDQELDLRQEGNKEFREALLGKEPGDEADVTLGEDDEEDDEEPTRFRLTLKKVQKLEKPELTDEFAQEQTGDEARNVDEYRSYVKSRIQNYYDQAANDMARQQLVDKMVEAHDFEVPDSFVEQVLNSYVQRVQQQYGNNLPDEFDEKSYKERMRDQGEHDAHWYFINEKLQEHFDDIEIKPEDIDEYIDAEAARYGMTSQQMKNMFAQNPQQLESLRNSIRENKVFDRLLEEVSINELSKEEYREKHENQEDREA